MSEELIPIELTEEQLATIVSGLLFACSVNVVSNTNQEYQKNLFDIAKQLKDIKPDIQLTEVQFVEEVNYEDLLSKEILTEFEGNIEVVTFDQV